MHTRSVELAEWLRERVTAAGARGLVVGLSGGLDSAVVARLCQMAVPEDVLGVMLPCQSDPADEADARLVAEHLGIPTLRIDLTAAYEGLTADLTAATAGLTVQKRSPVPSDEIDQQRRAALANVKPRLRMTCFYFLANSLDYLVAGTGNRCELTIGYFTKHGDGGVDLLPIGGLTKREVRALAVDLQVPQPILDKVPSAGLWLGQTDEEEMGFTYEQLERYLADGPEAVPPALALKIERLVRQNEHKRHMADTPELP